MTRKPFEVPDHSLWDDIKRQVAPLALRQGARTAMGLRLTPRAVPGAVTAHHDQTALHHAHSHHANPPPLMAFDRRLQQKLLRGQIEPEARLDLHGESLDSARMRLLHFLQSQGRGGRRIVLVITGKGSGALARHTLHGRDWHETPDRDGRLRREVPIWLHEAQFRALAIGFQPAHPKHGGGGALYIKLRRRSFEP
jgi:DNA-nicking Smr family endonuclease